MSDHSSIRSWLKTIDPGNPSSLTLHYESDQRKTHPGRSSTTKRKHDSQHSNADTNCRPPKIRRGQVLHKRNDLEPLHECDGNIMSPVHQKRKDPLEHENGYPPSTPNQSRRDGRHTARASNKIVRDFSKEDATPRAVRTGRLGLDEAPELFSKPSSQSNTNSTISATRSSASVSSTRSKSPVKYMTDLQMARRPTEPHRMDAIAAVEAGGVLVHYPRLVKISRGEAVIPHHLQDFMEDELPEADRPPKWAYTVDENTISAPEKEYQKSWAVKAKLLLEQALDCDQRGLSEANWNFKVHHPLLDLVVGHPKYGGMIEQINVTHARIQPKTLSPVHLSGDQMQSKMVDLVVLLRFKPQAQLQLRQILRCFPKDSQSINQTMQNPLREEPIAISIETKVPFSGEASADLQLAIWSGAGLLRTRGLLETLDQAKEQIPTLPMLSLHGHDLYLSAIQDRADHNRVYGKLRIGSTDSILGIFQIIAGLETLIDWSNAELREFYEEKILAPVL